VASATDQLCPAPELTRSPVGASDADTIYTTITQKAAEKQADRTIVRLDDSNADLGKVIQLLNARRGRAKLVREVVFVDRIDGKLEIVNVWPKITASCQCPGSN